jgi:hypothetical protein
MAVKSIALPFFLFKHQQTAVGALIRTRFVHEILLFSCGPEKRTKETIRVDLRIANDITAQKYVKANW